MHPLSTSVGPSHRLQSLIPKESGRSHNTGLGPHSFRMDLVLLPAYCSRDSALSACWSGDHTHLSQGPSRTSRGRSQNPVPPRPFFLMALEAGRVQALWCEELLQGSGASPSQPGLVPSARTSTPTTVLPAILDCCLQFHVRSEQSHAQTGW